MDCLFKHTMMKQLIIIVGLYVKNSMSVFKREKKIAFWWHERGWDFE